jgi:hypothetical protein
MTRVHIYCIIYYLCISAYLLKYLLLMHWQCATLISPRPRLLHRPKDSSHVYGPGGGSGRTPLIVAVIVICSAAWSGG